MANDNSKKIRTPRAATIKNWSKNASKSMAFSTLNVLKEIAPNIASTSSSASDAARDMRDFISKEKNELTRQGSILDKTRLARSAKDVFDSAMNDIKTGNFSLKKTSDDAFDSYDDIFGDIDTGTDSTSSPEEIREAGLGRAITASSSATIEGMRNMTNVLASTQLKSAKMASAKSANIAIFGINKINASLVGVNTRLDAINNNLVSLIKFQNQNVSVVNQAMLQYFDRSLDTMGQMMKAFDQTSHQYNSYSSKGNMDFLFGGMDIGEYGKYVKKNFNDSIIGTSLQMFKMMRSMDKMMGSDPKRYPQMALEKLIIPALMGNNLTGTIKKADENFEKYLKAGLYKIGDMKNDYSKGFGIKGNLMRMIGEMLGVERPTKGRIDMSSFSRESMMWNGDAQRALVEVIPSYLSRMEASLSIISKSSDADINKRRYVDNSALGKFERYTDVRKRYEKEKSDIVEMGMREATSKFDKYSKAQGLTQGQRDYADKNLTKLMNSALNGDMNITSKDFSKAIGEALSDFTSDMKKDLYTEFMNGINESAAALRKQNESIGRNLTGENSVYRNVMNARGSEPSGRVNLKNIMSGGYGFSANSMSIQDSINSYLFNIANPEDSAKGFNFTPKNSFLSEFQRAYNNDADDDKLRKLVADEYKRQKRDFFGKSMRKKFSDKMPQHTKFNNMAADYVDRADTAMFNMVNGPDILNPEYQRTHRVYKSNSTDWQGNATGFVMDTRKGSSSASSRASSITSGIGGSNVGKRAATSRSNGSTLVGASANTVNHQLDQNARRLPKNEKEMENMTTRDIESSLYGNNAAMLNTGKEIPGSAAENTPAAGIAELENAQTQNVKKQSSLMDSLKQTVISLHSGSMSVLSGLFGKEGFFRNFMNSDWMKEQTKKIWNYLFNEKDGKLNIITKSFLDAADYMKYVFNGKAYTDRKGVTHEATDNAVFSYLSKGYKTAFGFTMQHLFGDDYENNEIYQKYFSWLGGKEARAKAKSARAEREQAGPQKVQNPINKGTTNRNQKAIGAGSDLLALPAHNEALIVVPTTDKNGNKTELSFNVNDTEGIHVATEQNVVNATSTAIAQVNEGSKALSTVLMGKNKTADEAEKSFLQKFKDNLPKMLTAGIVGAGITLLSGGTMGPLLGAFLPSGIVGGAIVGMGVQIASTSEKFKKILLGDKDTESGERTGGIISKRMQASFKKALPTIVGGGIIGAITGGGMIAHVPGAGVLMSTLLPGGVLSGAILGLGASLLMNSESVKDILFGKEDSEGNRHEGLSHIFNGAKEVLSGISPYIKPALKGGAIGLGTGIVLSKMGYIGAAFSLGGPVGMGLLGLGIGIASQTDKFQKFLFGDEDPDHPGKRLKNGLFSKIEVLLQTRVFDPIGESLKYNAKMFANWVKGKIVIPFLQIFQPITNGLKDIGGYIKEKVDVLTDGIQHIVSGFFKKLFSPVAKLVGKIVSGVATGVRMAMQVALSPLAGVLGLVKLALAPGRELRDMKFKGKYLKGQYGDQNRGFGSRLKDVLGFSKDQSDYYAAHSEYADEMKSKGKRTNDWSLRQEAANTKQERKDIIREHRQSKALNNFAIKKTGQWGLNESVVLSEREIKALQKELGHDKYGNLNQEGLQTGDQLKQLLFHKGDWMDKYGPKAKINEQKVEDKTEHYQNTMEDKVTTIGNILSQAFFHTNAFKQPKRSVSSGASGFTARDVTTQNKSKEAQFNINDMEFGNIETLGHGIQNSKNLKAGFRAYSKRGMSANDYLKMMLGEDYETKIQNAGAATSAASTAKKPVAGADAKEQAESSNGAKTNRLFSAMAQIMSNGRLKTKHIKDILSGKKLTDKDATLYGSSSEEIGSNTAKGFAAVLDSRDKKAAKDAKKAAKINDEEKETEAASAGTQSLMVIPQNATQALATTDTKKTSTKKKSIFGSILGGVTNLFGGIIGGVTSLFSGSNILNTLKKLGIAVLLGVAFKDVFKAGGVAFMDKLEEYHPKIYAFLEKNIMPFFTNTIPSFWNGSVVPFFKETIPKWWTNTAVPFLNDTLPNFIINAAEGTATFITNHTEEIVDVTVSVLEAVVPAALKVVGRLLEDLWNKINPWSDKSSGKINNSKEANEQENANGKNTWKTGKKNADGSDQTVTPNANEDIIDNGDGTASVKKVNSVTGGQVARYAANTLINPKTMIKTTGKFLGTTVMVGSALTGNVAGFVGGGAISGAAKAVGKAGSAIINKGADAAGNAVENSIKDKAIKKAAADAAEKALQNSSTELLGQTVINGFTETAEKTAQKAASDTVKKENMTFLKSMLKKLSGALEKIKGNSKITAITSKASGLWGGFTKVCLDFVEKTLTKMESCKVGVINKLGAKIRNKLYKEGAETAAGAATGGIVTALFCANDLVTGLFQAGRLFNVDQSATDWKMDLISSLMTVLLGLGPGVIFDIAMEIIGDILNIDVKCLIASEVYKLVGGDDEYLEKAQDQLASEATLYNNEHGTNLSASAYSKKKNKTFWSSLGNSALKLIGKGDTTDYDKYENQAKAIIDSGGTVTTTATTQTSTLKTTREYGDTTSSSSSTTGLGPGEELSKRSKPRYGSGALSQSDPRWANYRIGTLPNGQPSTMAAGGCGPTALSTAAGIVGYGQDMSPIGMAKFAQKNGYIEQGGSNGNLFTQGASKLGMHSTSIDANGIENSIKNGNPVIISGRSSNGYGNNGASPYTNAGHIITATGMDNRGNFIIDNPETGNRELYSKSQLSSGMTGAWSMSRGSRHSNITSSYGIAHYGFGGGGRRGAVDSATTQASTIDSLYTSTPYVYNTSSSSKNKKSTQSFSKMSDITVTKWGSAHGSVSDKYNPFGLSNKELNFKLYLSTLDMYFKRGSITKHVYAVIKRFFQVSGGTGIINTREYINYRSLNQAYKNYLDGKRRDYQLNFFEYATFLSLLGIIRFYVNKLIGGNSIAHPGVSFEMSDIVVDQWGGNYPAGAARGNPFGLSPSQINSSISQDVLLTANKANSISDKGYAKIKTKLMRNRSGNTVKITIKDLNRLYSSGLSFSDYTNALKYGGFIKYHMKGAEATDEGISADEAADAQEALSGVMEAYKLNSGTTSTGLLKQIKNMVSAVTFVGSRALNSAGTDTAYQRIYDDNGNLLDTDAKAQFDDLIVNGDSSSDSSVDSSLTFNKNYNNKAGSGETRTELPTLQAKASAFIKNHLRTVMGSYDQYSVMPSLTLGQAGKESQWGSADGLSQTANNLFGIKSTNGWISSGGKTSSNGKWRKYDSVDASIADYAKVINAGYPDLIGSATYKQAMASGALKKYCPDAGYIPAVKKLIEDNGFNYYDNRANAANIKSTYGISWGLGPNYYGPTSTERTDNINNALYTSLNGINKKYDLGMTINDPSSTDTSYSTGDYGTFSTNAGTAKQNAVVNKMGSIMGKIKYSLGATQNPDLGTASCASTVGWAYRKALGVGGMSASSSAQSRDSRFTTIYTNNGNRINKSILRPGDIMYYNWDRSTFNNNSAYPMQHTEMYGGNGIDLSHGGPAEGPVEKQLNNYRLFHLMKVRRYNDFINRRGNYGQGPYYGNPSITDLYTSTVPNYNKIISSDIHYGNPSPFNINSTNHQNYHSYYGDASTDVISSDAEKNIRQKIDVAIKATDQGEKLNSIIGIMKDWFDYDKSKPSNTSIIANNGNQGATTVSNNTASSDNKLMTIHNKIASGKR